jgi:hypothetical protein
MREVTVMLASHECDRTARMIDTKSSESDQSTIVTPYTYEFILYSAVFFFPDIFSVRSDPRRFVPLRVRLCVLSVCRVLCVVCSGFTTVARL